MQLSLFDVPTEMVSQSELTPIDLRAVGIAIIRHCDGVSWTWRRRNPYGTGLVFGGAQEIVADAIAEARFLNRSLFEKGVAA